MPAVDDRAAVDGYQVTGRERLGGRRDGVRRRGCSTTSRCWRESRDSQGTTGSAGVADHRFGDLVEVERGHTGYGGLVHCLKSGCDERPATAMRRAQPGQRGSTILRVRIPGRVIIGSCRGRAARGRRPRISRRPRRRSAGCCGWRFQERPGLVGVHLHPVVDDLFGVICTAAALRRLNSSSSETANSRTASSLVSWLISISSSACLRHRAGVAVEDEAVWRRRTARCGPRPTCSSARMAQGRLRPGSAWLRARASVPSPMFSRNRSRWRSAGCRAFRTASPPASPCPPPAAEQNDSHFRNPS